MERVMVAVMMLVLGACAREAAGPALSDTEFIGVMAELRRAAEAAGADTAAFEARRDEILAQYGVTEADLRAFVESPGRDLHELAEIWDSVGVRLTPQEEMEDPVEDTMTELPRREPVLDSVRRRRPQLEIPR